MGVSENSGTSKSILIGISNINHPFWGTPIFGNTLIVAIHVTPLKITQRLSVSRRHRSCKTTSSTRVFQSDRVFSRFFVYTQLHHCIPFFTQKHHKKNTMNFTNSIFLLLTFWVCCFNPSSTQQKHESRYRDSGLVFRELAFFCFCLAIMVLRGQRR